MALFISRRHAPHQIVLLPGREARQRVADGHVLVHRAEYYARVDLVLGPDEDFHGPIAAWAQPGALTAMLNWHRALPGSAGSIRAERIRVPVRIIWGDRDAALDRGLAEAGLALCEQGEAFHLPDATHWVQHEEPEQVNRLLIEFLTKR